MIVLTTLLLEILNSILDGIVLSVKIILNLLPKISRSDPIIQLHDGKRNWIIRRYRIKTISFKRICLFTGRGRSVTRLTRSSRSTFLSHLRNRVVWGAQKSSW